MTKKHDNSQDGVSLMLSVLVLAAITAISFSLVTIVFIELRSSGDVIRSEPSLYATLGITEEALFQYKRFVNEREDGNKVDPPLLDVTSCEPDKSVCQLGDVSFEGGTDVQLLDEDVNPRLQTIYKGEDITIPLYGAADNFDAQYGLVTLQIVPAEHDYSLDVTLRSIPEGGNTTVRQNWTLSEGVFMQRTEMNTSGYQHDLIISNNSEENFLVEIRSYDTNGSTPKGLPFIGRKVLKVVANYLGITRSYWVNIPTGSAGGAASVVNVASSAQGGVASASSTINSSYPADSAINGDRTGAGWGAGTGGWNDAGSVPSWFQVNFSGTKNISEIHVYTLGNSWPITPDATTPATSYGLLAYRMQYWNGSSWVTVPGGDISGNDLMWRSATFPTVSTDRIRIDIVANRGGYSRIVEVEAY